jgi:hypothetical protein
MIKNIHLIYLSSNVSVIYEDNIFSRAQTEFKSPKTSHN